MAPPADIAPIGAAVATAPVAGPALALATVAPAPAAAASDAAAIAAQVVAADVAELVDATPAAAAPASPLAAMVAEAATQQQGLAPLLANLPAVATAPALPPAVRAVAAQILAAQAPLGADATGAELQAAARGSGVFLEAAIAAALAGSAGPPDTQQDMKALLLQLTAELAPLIEPPPAPARDAATARPPAAIARTAADAPAPPVAGGPTAGQRPAAPSLPPDATVATLARTLHQEAQGALARVQLSQAASVGAADEPKRWMFEVPVATPDGTGFAQLEISRDGGGGGASAAEPSWRVRVAIDAAPGGPVHADVLVGPGRTRVTLTAENESARAALAAGQAELTEALAAEQGGPDVAVRVIGGAPPRPIQPPGRLVDRRS
jgi:hypothetical protein